MLLDSLCLVQTLDVRMKGRNSEQRLESVIFETYRATRDGCYCGGFFTASNLTDDPDASVSRPVLRYLRPRLSGLQRLF